MSERKPLAIFREDEKTTATMKAISVRQPFGSWIATGVKTIETRPRYTKYRGELLIHAPKKLHELAKSGKIITRKIAECFPRGKMLCVVNLVDVRPMVPSDQGAAKCAIYDGAFSYVVTDPRPIVMFDYKGQLGLYNVDRSLVRYPDSILKMYIDNFDCDFVIAENEDEAKLLWAQHSGVRASESGECDEYDEMSFKEYRGVTFTFSDSSNCLGGVTKTVNEWIAMRGKGWFASTEF